jgi:hypothetical protein
MRNKIKIKNNGGSEEITLNAGLDTLAADSID